MASILLVDDDCLVNDMVRLHLESVGHAVTSAGHGGLGLQALASASFDLVITDILMPEVEGIEFVMAIRRLGHHVPVLAISGGVPQTSATGPLDYLHLVIKLGATAVLRKPFTRTQLLERVGHCLGTA
jgi:CheY-like chemotaxis protein